MNRTIKFRGKCPRNGEWVYGDLLPNPKSNITRIHSYDKEGKYRGIHRVDPKTVGQFTGFFDRDYTEIYEGDILEKEFKGHTECFIVVWDGDRFIVFNPTNGFTDSLFKQCVTHSDVRVIGTAYDSKTVILKYHRL